MDVLLLGEKNTFKTSFAKTVLTKEYPGDDYSNTESNNSYYGEILVGKEETFCFTFHEYCGDISSLKSCNYTGIEAIVFGFDITNHSSFQNLSKYPEHVEKYFKTPLKQLNTILIGFFFFYFYFYF